MTTALTTNNSSFADFLKNNQPKNNIQEKATANIKTNNQPDSFQKTTADKENAVIPNKKKKTKISKETILAFCYSVAACVAAGLILNQISKKGISAPKGIKGPKGISGQFQDLWVKLDDSLGLDDLALPKGLRNTVDGVIKCIENPNAIKDGGGEGIKSILLYGPPGTGKTTFVKALAKKFPNCEFASLDVTNLGSKYVGETEKNVQSAVNEICKQAKAHPEKKFFVFIDEIDSIMMIDEGSAKKHSNDVLNEFKRCFSERLGKCKNIITVGATNVPINPDTGKTLDGKRLDKPMLDRFQRKILVGLPSDEQLKNTILKHYDGKIRVCDELKNPKSDKLKALCETLAQEKHETSFRTLCSIFDDAAIEGDIKKEVNFQNIFNVLVSKKEEMHFGTDELKNLAQKLNVDFDTSKLAINQ